MTNSEVAPPVGSVDKALALIELLAEAGPDGMALRDVVEASGFNKASAHRTLQALQHRGFAEQDAKQRYRLGSRPVLLVERFYRDAPLLLIGGGSNELQRLIIARGLLERYKEPS